MSAISQTFANDLQGILPTGKSSSVLYRWLGVENLTSDLIGFVGRWRLPGKGSSKVDCGLCYWRGCLEVSLHHGEHEGKAYLQRAGRSCKRAECPVCYEKWASREAHRAVRRISQYRTNRRAIHVIMSPSSSDISLSYDDLRAKMYEIADQVGIIGGMSIFHAFRSLCEVCQKDKEHCDCGEAQNLKWYLSPHFHLVCYGWVSGEQVGAVFESQGWVVKNLGVRESVASTIAYQLSHAGIHHKQEGCSVHGDEVDCAIFSDDCHKDGRKKATITWFGDLSYNRLKVDKSVMDEKPKCPLCESELHECVFTAYQANFDDIPEGVEIFPDPFGWEYLLDKYKPAERHEPAEWSAFLGSGLVS